MVHQRLSCLGHAQCHRVDLLIIAEDEYALKYRWKCKMDAERPERRERWLIYRLLALACPANSVLNEVIWGMVIRHNSVDSGIICTIDMHHTTDRA